MSLTPMQWQERDVRLSGEITRLRSELEAVKRERDEARGIVRDIHWMAVRYADNRKSYAVGMCNDALRKAYDGGWLVYGGCRQHDLDPQYARDGMFDKEWRSAVDAANDRAHAAESALSRMKGALEQTRGDLDEFMRRLGPRWFLEQNWFPQSVEAHDGL